MVSVSIIAFQVLRWTLHHEEFLEKFQLHLSDTVSSPHLSAIAILLRNQHNLSHVHFFFQNAGRAGVVLVSLSHVGHESAVNRKFLLEATEEPLHSCRGALDNV